MAALPSRSGHPGGGTEVWSRWAGVQPGWAVGLSAGGSVRPPWIASLSQRFRAEGSQRRWPRAGVFLALGFLSYFCVDTGIPLLSAVEEAITGLWEITGGLSSVRWLCFHHPGPVSGSGPISSLHQAWVRGCSVWMSRR